MGSSGSSPVLHSLTWSELEEWPRRRFSHLSPRTLVRECCLNWKRPLSEHYGPSSTIGSRRCCPSMLGLSPGKRSNEQRRETMQVWNATTGHFLNSYLVPSSAGEACRTFPLAWSPGG